MTWRRGQQNNMVTNDDFPFDIIKYFYLVLLTFLYMNQNDSVVYQFTNTEQDCCRELRIQFGSALRFPPWTLIYLSFFKKEVDKKGVCAWKGEKTSPTGSKIMSSYACIHHCSFYVTQQALTVWLCCSWETSHCFDLSCFEIKMGMTLSVCVLVMGRLVGSPWGPSFFVMVAV